MAVRILIGNGAHSSVSGFFFYYKQQLTTVQRTNLEAAANGAMKFLNTDFLHSLAKGAMMLRAVGKFAMMPVQAYSRLKTAR
jgi:hypothetical protein